jgi:hypothetical protein
MGVYWVYRARSIINRMINIVIVVLGYVGFEVKGCKNEGLWV